MNNTVGRSKTLRGLGVVRTAAMTKAGKPCSWGHFREETEAGFRQAEEGAHRRGQTDRATSKERRWERSPGWMRS